MTTTKKRPNFSAMRDTGESATKDTTLSRERAAVSRDITSSTPPSREGKKAVTNYVSPEMAKALKLTALKLDTTLQELVIEAYDDVLRKHGETPIGG